MSDSPIFIYIVDDEPPVCSAYARLMRSANMQSRTFESIEDFMLAKCSDQNACVISDMRMSGMSGIELPGLLASAGRNLPVIIVTAHDSPEERKAAREAGVMAFFRKPVDDQALLDAVEWAVTAGSVSAPA
jgi:FixJ family two-component response regulator